MLSGEAEGLILERLWNENKRSNYQKHAAEKLTTSQLKLISYGRINWVANREFDYELYVAYRERVWEDWQYFVEEQVKQAYKWLWLHMLKGKIHFGVARVKQLEQQLVASLLDDVLQYFSTEGIESDIDRWDLEELFVRSLKFHIVNKKFGFLEKNKILNNYKNKKRYRLCKLCISNPKFYGQRFLFYRLNST